MYLGRPVLEPDHSASDFAEMGTSEMDVRPWPPSRWWDYDSCGASGRCRTRVEGHALSDSGTAPGSPPEVVLRTENQTWADRKIR
jgi:hypothetical protein